MTAPSNARPDTPASSRPADPAALDALTGGVFSAATSGERSTRLRAWLAGSPPAEQLQAVFRELSAKDKGAAKLLRERLDEIKRSRDQEAMAQEWAERAGVLLALPRLNIADAMAWQRDAARAGAPLSREPLLALKTQLAERVRAIEDLQRRVQVQREAAVLLAQRIEVLSTKSWHDAQAASAALSADVAHWHEQALALSADPGWPSVEARFPPLLDHSAAQLRVVASAFAEALAQTVSAAADASLPLPAVPVWADEIRAQRGVAAEPAPKPVVDPQIRAQAASAVAEVLSKLEQEIAQGHGKASAGAAAALRQALKEHGRLIDERLDAQAHAALSAAGELEGWQRWRANQLREELVAKAEGLLQRPAGQAIGGRKMQENLRVLREQWKQTDQGGIPNHALWKRFDEACNEAHKVVEAWIEKVKAEAAEHRAQRLALVAELQAWAADNRTARDGDWKGFARVLHQFGERWREAGHVGEKLFAELQPAWKAAMAEAGAPLEAVQQASMALRQALIEESVRLGAAPQLRIDAVRGLQQRWQAEAQRIPLERRQEQKLWDAFRKPIDEAFQRKTQEREQADAALGARDRAVLEASRTLEQANASGDAAAIRAAMKALDEALQHQAQAQAGQAAAVQAQGETAAAAGSVAAAAGPAGADAAPDAATHAAAAAEPAAAAPVETPAGPAEAGADAPVAAPAAPAPRAAPRPVVAVRGDDRPGLQRPAAASPARPGDRRDAARGAGARDAGGGRPGSWGGRDERSAPRG
ncbi:MAG: DUF349 domain-containing protein, partial [Rhodoferax sp.]|nr:DUF349 domain-containing protein [Rhodoferax sp.]